MTKTIDREFIAEVESKHFRTDADTGANQNAMMIWNIVREYVGLSRLRVQDLPAFCVTHGRYHLINNEYGCQREKK